MAGWLQRQRNLKAQLEIERERRASIEAIAHAERRHRESIERSLRAITDAAAPGLKYTSPRDQLWPKLSVSAYVLSIVTLVGILIYGYAWLFYGAFYSAFGLRPEDVGLTYATVLPNVGGAITIFAVHLLLAIAVWGGTYHLIRVEGQRHKIRTIVGVLVVGTLLTAAGIARVLGGFDAYILGPFLSFSVITIGIVTVGIGLYGIRSKPQVELQEALHHEIASEDSLASAHSRLTALLLACGLAGGLILISLGITLQTAFHLANNVQGCKLASDRLGIHLTPVHVSWVGSASSPLPTSPKNQAFIYMGQSDGTMVLYNRARGYKALHRLSSQLIVVRSISDDQLRC